MKVMSWYHRNTLKELKSNIESPVLGKKESLPSTIKKKPIFILDTESKFTKLPVWLRIFFCRDYSCQGFVYINSINKPVHVSDTIKWLDEFIINTSSEKEADKIAFKYLRNKYPNYKGYLNLF